MLRTGQGAHRDAHGVHQGEQADPAGLAGQGAVQRLRGHVQQVHRATHRLLRDSRLGAAPHSRGLHRPSDWSVLFGRHGRSDGLVGSVAAGVHEVAGAGALRARGLRGDQDEEGVGGERVLWTVPRCGTRAHQELHRNWMQHDCDPVRPRQVH